MDKGDPRVFEEAETALSSLSQCFKLGRMLEAEDIFSDFTRLRAKVLVEYELILRRVLLSRAPGIRDAVVV